MEIATLVLLFAGGFVSGAITAVAGGGSFLTFPMLLAAGLPPMSANITNWVALIPGNGMALAGYRKELTEMRHEVRAHLWVAAVVTWVLTVVAVAYLLVNWIVPLG